MRNCFGQYGIPSCEKNHCPAWDECRYTESVLADRLNLVIKCERLEDELDELRKSGIEAYICQFGDLISHAKEKSEMDAMG